ncbi:cytochrome d ubiquinol oxidase subunit II [Amorphus coralli]|uniref:cytochrome d ubiquinol oxidase subunit II n=1 Tax=Amorphus coralli TaxID=340680 RepID=UPI00036D7C05|nr:cytochrome d ubiquinol oxidase subunit II [Amorphus coralli]
METYLPVIWGGLIAAAITLYVILDGFDLGIGILFPFGRSEAERDHMMNSVAPFWDGNETWLILGGGGLWVAFPSAFSVIMPAMYIPVILMLLALVFRGVAFEFRFVSKPHHKMWDIAFSAGSIVAAFCQGLVLGGVLDGIAVTDGQFSGGPFDFLSPFAIACGLGLICGYALLGSTWLMMRVDGTAGVKARGWAFTALVLMLIFIVVVSIWTPLFDQHIAERWFSRPNIYVLWLVPLATAALALVAMRGIDAHKGFQAFAASVGLYLLCFLGLGISTFPYLIPPTLTVWDTAAVPASQLFTLFGILVMLPIILMYTAFVYWTFRGKLAEGEGYH